MSPISVSKPVTKKKRRTLAGFIARGLLFNIAVTAHLTPNDIVRPHTTSLAPPVETILSDARHKGIEAPDANALHDTVGKDEAMAWAYLNTPAQVDAYYAKLEKAIEERCEGALQNCPQTYQLYAQTLYKNFRASDDFRAWDIKHREIFVLSVSTDPVLIKARQNWGIIDKDAPGYMTLQDRLNTVARIAAFYTGSFSVDGVQFKAPKAVAVKSMRADAGAFYYPDYNLIENRIGDLMTHSFEEMAMYTAHEARHSLQHQLGVLTKNPEGFAYLKAHRILSEAKIFALSDSAGQAYYETTNDPGYKVSVIENDAYARQGDGLMVGLNTMVGDEVFRDMRRNHEQETAQNAELKVMFSAHATPPVVTAVLQSQPQTPMTPDSPSPVLLLTPNTALF